MARSGEGDFAIQIDPNLTPEVVEELKDSPVILNLAEAKSSKVMDANGIEIAKGVLERVDDRPYDQRRRLERVIQNDIDTGAPCKPPYKLERVELWAKDHAVALGARQIMVEKVNLDSNAAAIVDRLYGCARKHASQSPTQSVYFVREFFAGHNAPLWEYGLWW